MSTTEPEKEPSIVDEIKKELEQEARAAAAAAQEQESDPPQPEGPPLLDPVPAAQAVAMAQPVPMVDPQEGPKQEDGIILKLPTTHPTPEEAAAAAALVLTEAAANDPLEEVKKEVWNAAAGEVKMKSDGTPARPRGPHGMRFTDQEKQLLKDGVKEFYGQYPLWKKIKDKYSDVFAARTTVDLKDCYRNMVKTGAADPIKSKHPKVKWTPEEKEAVKEGIKLFGTKAWTAIKKHFGQILDRRSANQLKDCHRTMLRNGVVFEENIEDDDEEKMVDDELLSPETKARLELDKSKKNKKKRRRSSVKAKAAVAAAHTPRKKLRKEIMTKSPELDTTPTQVKEV